MQTPLVAATPVQLTCAGAADAVTAAELRRALQRWLRDVTEVSADVRDGMILGASEALANCVEHAYRAHHTLGTMRLQASHYPAARSIKVCISDRGTWHRPLRRKPSDPGASRGIMLMHTLADHCSINARPNGVTVCLDYTTDPNRLKDPTIGAYWPGGGSPGNQSVRPSRIPRLIFSLSSGLPVGAVSRPLDLRVLKGFGSVPAESGSAPAGGAPPTQQPRAIAMPTGNLVTSWRYRADRSGCAVGIAALLSACDDADIG